MRIILVSANFGREITTTALWINKFDRMDIRCIRLVPYQPDGNVYLDIQQVIPLPVAQDYQVRLCRKEAARERSRYRVRRTRFTRYQIVVRGIESEPLKKRQAVLAMITELGKVGVMYDEMASLLRPIALRSVSGLITDSDLLFG